VTQVFRLRAAHPGEYRLTFTLRRSWEEQSVETRTLKVIAE
jgi:predicted secreted protein